MTDRRVPAIVLGKLNTETDGSTHDPLLHPELYEGVLVRRMGAFVLDMLLLTILTFVLLLPLGVTAALLPFLTMGGAVLLLKVVYDVVTIGGPASATPGMRLCGLKVVTWSGNRPDNAQAFVMAALFWVIYLVTGWLAAIVALLNPRWRCAHDFLAGTVVVRSNPRPRLT